MPGYKSHLTAGGVAAVVVLAHTHWALPTGSLVTPENLWYIGACLFGSLFPDIDIKSKGQRLWYYALAPCIALATWFGSISLLGALGVLSVIPPLLPHRGITHESWFVVCAPLAVPFVLWLYHPAHLILGFNLYGYFVLGAFTHLILDFGVMKFIKRGLYRKNRK